MPGQHPKSITYKYDLMHLNTPSFASSVVTWDCDKLTKITKKRVIDALKNGFIKYGGGDAASMYSEIRKRFEIPHYAISTPTFKTTGEIKLSGRIDWDYATPQLLDAIEPLYQVERVAKRLEGNWVPWYLTADSIKDSQYKHFYFETDHDLTEVRKCIDEIMNSPDIAKKREEALNFVLAGGKLEFTYKE